MKIDLPIFETRDELLIYLINHYELGNGVEVGVRDGHFSDFLLRNTHDKFYLLGLDYYVTHELKDFVNKKHPRYLFGHGNSVDISKQLADDHIDMIHIDAGHTYKDVMDDLNAWWPKLRKGGFFTGDDYCFCNTPNEGDYGIVQALEDWVEENGIADIYLTRLGWADKDARFKIAIDVGKQVEDNFKRDKEPERPYHENAYVPNWLIVKD